MLHRNKDAFSPDMVSGVTIRGLDVVPYTVSLNTLANAHAVHSVRIFLHVIIVTTYNGV